MLLAIWGFVRALSVDHAKRQTLLSANVGPAGGARSSDWKVRLQNLLRYPDKVGVTDYIGAVVVPSMQEFAAELVDNGLVAEVAVSDTGDEATLKVMHGDETDFQYLVLGRRHVKPHEALIGEHHKDSGGYYRAEVHLREGSQDYDLMGWSREQVLHDLLEQYEKHLHFLHVLR